MGKFLKHEDCPQCHKKNLGRWDDGGATCFTAGCGHWESKNDGDKPDFMINDKPKKSAQRPVEMTGVPASIPQRRVSQETCVKYGVTVEYNSEGEISKIHYPYSDQDGEVVAEQVRRCGDDVTKKRRFYCAGDMRADMQLFGQKECRGGGKFITIVEGPGDVLSVSEMFDRRWDVVSVRSGSSHMKQELAAEIEFLESYEHVVWCGDNDDAGAEALKECQDLFSPGKLKIVKLPVKDAGEMLQDKRVKEFMAAWWDAKDYTPGGIVEVVDTWDAVLKYRDTPSVPYPWDGLNNMLLGDRRQEIVVWAAETGVGKSQTMREIQDNLIEVLPPEERVGCLMLEESIAKTTLGWMSFHAQEPLHKRLSDIPDEELKKYWDMATAGNRFVLLEHKGWQNNLETLKARIRYMRYSMGCTRIVLDHLHIALSSISGATGDWSGIDELMTDLVSLVQDIDVGLHLVSHVSEGRALRGSKGIEKLADAVIYLERDKHHEDPEIANTTQVVVDKNRWGGGLGTACYLRYDPVTTRMTECAKPEALNEDVHSEF